MSGVGIGCTVLWTQIVQALRADGFDVADKAGPATAVCIRALVTDFLAAPNVSEVTRQLIERDAHGQRKYGTSLDRTDLTLGDWLQHQAEELMDGAGYALAAKGRLQQLVQDMETVIGIYPDGERISISYVHEWLKMLKGEAIK